MMGLLREGAAPPLCALVLPLFLLLLLPGGAWQPAAAAPADALDPDYGALPPAPAPAPAAATAEYPLRQLRPFVVTAPPPSFLKPSPRNRPSPFTRPSPTPPAGGAPQEGEGWTEEPPTTDREAEAADLESLLTDAPSTAPTDHAATEWTGAMADDASAWTTEGEADDAGTTQETATDAPGTTAAPARAEPVLFLLYTRAHPLRPVVLRNDSLEGSDFDVGRSTVFVLHGFTGDSASESVTLVRDALLWAEEANVVAVDWAPLAAGPHYAEAVDNTRHVAGEVAARVVALAAAGLPLAQVHLVGFSLGAQVAGQAGSLLARDPRAGRPARITALDPARPGFHDVDDGQRLDAGDADFVAVLHTASGIVSFEEPLGHADFYPNGGRSPQPACAGQPVHVVCSHLIAPRYFAESIYHERSFRGVRCRSWRDYEAGLCAGAEEAFLGPHLPPSTRGSFFLRTNAQEPFGRAHAPDETGTTSAPDDYDGDDNRVDGLTAHQQGAATGGAASCPPAAWPPLLLLAAALLAARARTR